MEKRPRISVIIVSFNSRFFLERCLKSLAAEGIIDLEVIVVDNGSKDGTPDFIKENFPGISLISNKINRGAAKARNQAISLAKAEWVLTLDCDIVLENNFFRNLEKIICRLDERTGMVQPKMLNPDKKTIYSAGILLSGLKKFYDIGKGKPENKFSQNKKIFGPCCAAALYSKKMLEEIKEETGYFDERMFFLVEDVDLAWRAREKGWQAGYFPQLICYHHGNSSLFGAKERQFLCWRNRGLMLKKHRLSFLNSAGNFIIYDLWRLIFLFFTNQYVRRIFSRKTTETSFYLPFLRKKSPVIQEV